jgi:hypothetical protein
MMTTSPFDIVAPGALPPQVAAADQLPLTEAVYVVAEEFLLNPIRDMARITAV